MVAYVSNCRYETITAVQDNTVFDTNINVWPLQFCLVIYANQGSGKAILSYCVEVFLCLYTVSLIKPLKNMQRLHMFTNTQMMLSVKELVAFKLYIDSE